MLLEQIGKLDCDRCKLRTEHYFLSDDGNLILTRCLRCGAAKTGAEAASGEVQEAYPVDESRPAYVV